MKPLKIVITNYAKRFCSENCCSWKRESVWGEVELLEHQYQISKLMECTRKQQNANIILPASIPSPQMVSTKGLPPLVYIKVNYHNCITCETGGGCTVIANITHVRGCTWNTTVPSLLSVRASLTYAVEIYIVTIQSWIMGFLTLSWPVSVTPFSGWCANKGADSTWTVGSGAYRRWDKVSLPHSQPAGMSRDIITGPYFGDGLVSYPGHALFISYMAWVQG